MSGVIDSRGFRSAVSVIILNQKDKVFWARRVDHNGWQFPQGGLSHGETAQDAMYRELYEEVGLQEKDVDILAESQKWLYYYLPKQLIRRRSYPLCIGQKQKWFLLRLTSGDDAFNFTCTDHPEFDEFRWVHYWHPVKQVVFFKRSLYKKALREFASIVQPENNNA